MLTNSLESNLSRSKLDLLVIYEDLSEFMSVLDFHLSKFVILSMKNRTCGLLSSIKNQITLKDRV